MFIKMKNSEKLPIKCNTQNRLSQKDSRTIRYLTEQPIHIELCLQKL
jgi:hypothetical protein